MRILFVITGLEIGGAESQLFLLATALQQRGHLVHVVSLTSKGAFGQKFVDLGIPLAVLGLGRSVLDLAAWGRLRKLIREWNADIVQSWLHHADLIASLAWLGSGRRGKLVWGIRCSHLDRRDHSRTLFLALRGLALISRLPAAIIANSEPGRLAHEQVGYHPRRWAVIPNAVNSGDFVPSIEARASVRKELGLPTDAVLVGHVARWDPMKDHGTLLQAIEKLVPKHPDVVFVLVGPGVSMSSGALKQQIVAQNIARNVRVLGGRTDIARFQAAWDIAVCSSYSEGFPNALAEAMSCEVPCVTTDVGAAAHLVGDRNLVVPPRDPAALSSALDHLLSLSASERQSYGIAARQRIIKMFSVDAIVGQYLNLYAQICQATGPLKHVHSGR